MRFKNMDELLTQMYVRIYHYFMTQVMLEILI